MRVGGGEERGVGGFGGEGEEELVLVIEYWRGLRHCWTVCEGERERERGFDLKRGREMEG